MKLPGGDPRIDARAIAHFQAGEIKLALVIEYRWSIMPMSSPVPTYALPELEGMAPLLVLEDWPNAQPRDDGVYKSSQARDGGVLQTRTMIYAQHGAEVEHGELVLSQIHDEMYHVRDITETAL